MYQLLFYRQIQSQVRTKSVFIDLIAKIYSHISMNRIIMTADIDQYPYRIRVY